MLMMITMMVITTISSTKVKPSRPLPLRIRRSIGCSLLCLAVNREDVLPAPIGGLRVVLIAAKAPFGLAGEGVERNGAEEADLLAVGVIGQLDAFDELLER